eukprot:g11274.t1
MELSHRDPHGPVQALMVSLQRKIKSLLQVPDNYHVLLMPGGAHQQFSAVLLNLCDATKNSPPHYVDSGYWSRRAAGIADAYCRREYGAKYSELFTPDSTTAEVCGKDVFADQKAAASPVSTRSGGHEERMSSCSEEEENADIDAGFSSPERAAVGGAAAVRRSSSSDFDLSGLSPDVGKSLTSELAGSRSTTRSASSATVCSSAPSSASSADEEDHVSLSLVGSPSSSSPTTTAAHSPAPRTLPLLPKLTPGCIPQGHPLYCNADRGCLNPPRSWAHNVRPDAAYVYVCLNETIEGLELLTDYDLGVENVPLVADATSTLFSREIDVAKYGVIFASAGKNLGPSGIAVVLVREDLIAGNRLHPGAGVDDAGRAGVGKNCCSAEKRFELEAFPMLNWGSFAFSQPIQNLYNTPPTYPLYLTYLTLETTEQKGGMPAMAAKAKKLAEKCYDFFDADATGFYQSVVVREFSAQRSRMNVCFRIGGVRAEQDEHTQKMIRSLEDECCEFVAKEYNVVQLAGHPVAGGLRFSLYNASTEASVDVGLGALAALREKCLRENRLPF